MDMVLPIGDDQVLGPALGVGFSGPLGEVPPRVDTSATETGVAIQVVRRPPSGTAAVARATEGDPP